jgi:hypothetical protein
VGLLDHIADLLAQLQGAGRGRQTAAGTHQHRVTQRGADPAQGAAHRRRAQVHPARGGGHAAFVNQHVQCQQQVQVRQGHDSLQ